MNSHRKRSQYGFARRGASASTRQAGFSLVEILLVILIILMLAGALVVYVLPQQKGAQVKTTEIKLKAIANGLQKYSLDLQSFPRQEHGGLKALLEQPNYENEKHRAAWNGPYIDRTTTFDDAWGHTLRFELVDPNQKQKKSDPDFHLYSVGPDGQANTEDDVSLYKRNQGGTGDGEAGGPGSLDGTIPTPPGGAGTGTPTGNTGGGNATTPTPPGPGPGTGTGNTGGTP